MNIKDLKKMYDNLIITNGEDFWKFTILKHLINNEEKNVKSLNITEERIEQYGFIENIDFTTFSQNCEKPQGGRPTTDGAKIYGK